MIITKSIVMTSKLPKVFDVEKRGGGGRLSAFCKLCFIFQSLTAWAGPPLPHSWTSAGRSCPLPGGVTWPLSSPSTARLSWMPTMTVVFIVIVLQGNPAAAPHPSSPARQDSPGNRPPVGGGPRSRRPLPSATAFPGLPGSGAFLQKEVSSAPGKVLELQQSPAAWACPHAPRRRPLPSSAPCWSQAAPEGSDRPLPAIVSLDAVRGRPALPVSLPEPGLSDVPAHPLRPRQLSFAALSAAGRGGPGVRGHRGNRPGRGVRGHRATVGQGRRRSAVAALSLPASQIGAAAKGGLGAPHSKKSPRAGGRTACPAFSSDHRGPERRPPHLLVPLGVPSRKRRREVGGGACLHLMDGTEEMSGTFFPRGGGEAAATSPPHSFAFLPACSGRAWGGGLEQGQLRVILQTLTFVYTGMGSVDKSQPR